MIRSRRLVGLPVALPVLAAVLAGCGKDIPVTQFPPFYTPDLKAVAVVPFEDRTGRPAAGQGLAVKVAAALAARRTYTVYGPGELASLAGAVDPAALQAGRLDGLIQALRARGQVQAVLAGTVTLFDVVQSTQWRERPVYYVDRRGRRRISHNEPYQHTRNVATVDASARLIRVADGAELHGTPPGLGRVKVVSESPEDGGGPPPLSQAQCLTSAIEHCADRLAEPFAISYRKVRAGRNALRTAHRIEGDEWKGGKKFRPTDKRLIVVVKLPPEADRNTFRMDITRKGAEQVLASHEFTWQRQWSAGPGEGFEFDLQDVLTRGGGPGKYAVVLYAGDRAALKTEFKVEDKDGKD